jgi:hypothetical protein
MDSRVRDRDRGVVNDANLLTELFIEKFQSRDCNHESSCNDDMVESQVNRATMLLDEFQAYVSILDCRPCDIGTTSGAPGQPARQAERSELRSTGEAAHGTKVVR